jgi:hypothetical protein
MNGDLSISDLETLDLKSYDKFVLQILISLESYECSTGVRLTSKKYLESCAGVISCGSVDGEIYEKIKN